MFSNTDKRMNRLLTWKLRASPMRLISKGLRPVMSCPCSRICPLLAPKRPLIRLNRVDLPAPLGPMIATRSPARTARLAPRMISVLPKFLRSSRSSTASGAALMRTPAS